MLTALNRAANKSATRGLPWSIMAMRPFAASASCWADNVSQNSKRSKVVTDATPPRERHGAFYREVIPPFGKVLVYSAVSYFALYGTWRILNDQAATNEADSTP